MNQTITLTQALTLRDQGILMIDARSPAEYKETTIPGAINVPLLDDVEREEIGTLYKQEGKSAARHRGVEIVAPKIVGMVRQIEKARPKGTSLVIVFCWRGGMRSQALTQFLELAGIPARQLSGGHKAFRRHVLQFFDQADWGRLIVIRGLTGVGKTKVLKRLAEEGAPVIDLEELASHRGSAFGDLGLPPQPTQKFFEALLWDKLRHVPRGGYAVVEGESRRIGRVMLPLRMHQAMQLETTIWLNASISTRVRNILSEYPALDSLKAEFVLPIQSLRERLGKQVVKELLALLDAGQWQDLVHELMTRYYDPLYRHTLPDRRLEVDVDIPDQGLSRVRSTIAQILGNSGEQMAK